MRHRNLTLQINVLEEETRRKIAGMPHLELQPRLSRKKINMKGRKTSQDGRPEMPTASYLFTMEEDPEIPYFHCVNL